MDIHIEALLHLKHVHLHFDRYPYIFGQFGIRLKHCPGLPVTQCCVSPNLSYFRRVDLLMASRDRKKTIHEDR